MLGSIVRRSLLFSKGSPCTRRLCKSSKFLCSQNSDNSPGDIEKLLKDLYKDFDVKLQEPSKSFKSEFEPFKDEDSQIIYDIDEERAIRRNKGILPDDFRTKNEIKSALMEKIYSENEKRGQSGVFDVEELVNILKKEKCFDVCVLDVSSHSPFFEHLIIITCKSKRVMSGVSKYIKKLYKFKSPGDAGPNIEGLRGDASWFAMDLGNIALHFFLHEERLKMDLESLWGVGPFLDEKSMAARQQEDSFVVSPLSDFTPHDVAS